ncbi:hypothetical protein FI667_g12648, partial [Globisporangium splendens]
MPLETTLDKIDDSKIARWRLPSMLGGDDLLLPLSAKVEIRASCIDGVSANGGSMQRFADLVAQHREWFQEPLCNKMDNDIGEVAALDFERHMGDTGDHNHYDGQGSITLRVTMEKEKPIDPVIASKFLKLMKESRLICLAVFVCTA